MESQRFETTATSWLSSEEASCREDPGFDKLLEHSLQTQPRSCLSHTFRQGICMVAAWSAVFLGCGADSGFTSQPLHRRQAQTGDLYHLDHSWKEWKPTISIISGCILSAFAMSFYGRRKPLIFISIPLTLRWLLVAFFEKESIELAATVIGAVCRGFLWTLAPIYIGEISDPKQRGWCLACLALITSMGSLFSHAAQMFVSRMFLAKIYATSSICVALLAFLSFESPFWLISNGRRVDAIKVFGLLRGYQISAIKELRCLLDIETKHFGKSKYFFNFFRLFKIHVLKPTAVFIIFNTFAAFCGLHFLNLYSQRFFSTISAKEWRPANIQITLESLQSLLLVLSCILFKKYSRRSICIWSCVCIFMTSLLSVVFFIVTSQGPVSFILWIPLTCYIGFSCALTIGLLPLSWVLSGELLPLEARGSSSCICNCFSLAAVFASMKATFLVVSLANSTVLYVMYGLTSLIFAFVMNSVLVETKGKTLIDIESINKRSSLNYL